MYYLVNLILRRIKGINGEFWHVISLLAYRLETHEKAVHFLLDDDYKEVIGDTAALAFPNLSWSGL